MGKYLPILTIARCGSFNKAAGELGYSQPNLWHIVNNLEDELGAKLFHRSRQGVTLTDAGEVLLERMARIEAQESSLFQTAQTFQRNQIRLGLCPGLSAAWVAALLSTLKATAPDLHVKLETPETYRDGLTAVADQGLDLCFSVLPGSPDVEAVTLWEEPFVLAAGADHPLARLDRVSLADVVGKVHERSSDIIQMIKTGKIHMVINTLTQGSHSPKGTGGVSAEQSMSSWRTPWPWTPGSPSLWRNGGWGWPFCQKQQWRVLRARSGVSP